MANPDPGKPTNKRFFWRGSNSHISISDTETIASVDESFHSPLRSESPFRSDDPYFQQESNHLGKRGGKSHVSFDKYYTPLPSPGISNFLAWSPPATAMDWKRTRSQNPSSGNADFPANERASADLTAEGNSPVVLGLNKLAKDEPVSSWRKFNPFGGGLGEGWESEVAGGERRSRAVVVMRSERSAAVGKAALLFRVFEAIVCLISFSVMAADKTRGWSGDSYDRYKEYRYCVAVNIIGFIYSGFQACSLAFHVVTGKHVIPYDLHYPFDFSMDQILAYLTLSASSSAATRVTTWILNWGKDEFTAMASASIAMSFLGFIAFAFSSLISGYSFCNHDST